MGKCYAPRPSRRDRFASDALRRGNRGRGRGSPLSVRRVRSAQRRPVTRLRIPDDGECRHLGLRAHKLFLEGLVGLDAHVDGQEAIAAGFAAAMHADDYTFYVSRRSRSRACVGMKALLLELTGAPAADERQGRLRCT